MTAGPVTRTSASDRRRGCWPIIPWVAAHDGPTVDEVCDRFGVIEAEAARRPRPLVFVRRAPVHARHAHRRHRRGRPGVAPLRRRASPAPCASRPSRAWPWWPRERPRWPCPARDPEGPLATALAKLAGVLGVDPADAVSTSTLGDAAPGACSTRCGRLSPSGRQVEIDYYAYGRDERTTRTVDPYGRLRRRRGSGTCTAGATWREADRLFRVDRIVDVDAARRDVRRPRPPAATRRRSAPVPTIPRVTLRARARGPVGGREVPGRGRSSRRRGRVAAGPLAVTATALARTAARCASVADAAWCGRRTGRTRPPGAMRPAGSWPATAATEPTPTCMVAARPERLRHPGGNVHCAVRDMPTPAGRPRRRPASSTFRGAPDGSGDRRPLGAPGPRRVHDRGAPGPDRRGR